MLNYPVILYHRRSTTVSLETYPFIQLNEDQFRRYFENLNDKNSINCSITGWCDSEFVHVTNISAKVRCEFYALESYNIDTIPNYCIHSKRDLALEKKNLNI